MWANAWEFSCIVREFSWFACFHLGVCHADSFFWKLQNKHLRESKGFLEQNRKLFHSFTVFGNLKAFRSKIDNWFTFYSFWKFGGRPEIRVFGNSKTSTSGNLMAFGSKVENRFTTLQFLEIWQAMPGISSKLQISVSFEIRKQGRHIFPKRYRFTALSLSGQPFRFWPAPPLDQEKLCINLWNLAKPQQNTSFCTKSWLCVDIKSTIQNQDKLKQITTLRYI